MTALEQVLGKKILERIDHYRRDHGIRTRKAALEAIVVAAVPLEENDAEHPLTRKLRLAMEHPGNEKISPQMRRTLKEAQEQQKNGTLETFSLEEVMEGIRRRPLGG
jgi:hypothetical protein